LTFSRRGLVVALLAAPLALRAQDIEVIALAHRSAEQLLPLLRPMVDPGGALTGRGHQLFLRTSAANRRQLLELLRALDTPPRQLQITVRQDLAGERHHELRGADGSLTVDTRGAGAGATVMAGSSRSLSTQGATQRIRVLEGASAYIAMGAAIPMTFRQWVATPQGLTEVRATAYYDAVTGFHARPLLAGDEVTLELTPEQSAVAATGIERAQLSTTVRGRLGEWIAVGGADINRQAQTSGTFASSRDGESGARGVWLKVEAIDLPAR
jgi:hypothetical protein